MATTTIPLSSAAVARVGGLNPTHIQIADVDKNDKCEKYCKYISIVIILCVLVLFIVSVYFGVNSMLESEKISSLATSIQSATKHFQNYTEIDPDILTKQHHQKTVKKVATKRIKQRPKHQLSFYDNIGNMDTNNIKNTNPDSNNLDNNNDAVPNNDNNNSDTKNNKKSLKRNYETLRAMHSKPSIYLGRKSHPKLIKQKQKDAKSGLLQLMTVKNPSIQIQAKQQNVLNQDGMERNEK